MARVRVLAARAGPINNDKLWIEARAAWANLLDISDVDGTNLGFDFDGSAPTTTQVQALVTAHDPSPLPPTPAQQQLAADKALVIAFFNNASGTATNAQRDDVTKAVIRYLRRSGNDA